MLAANANIRTYLENPSGIGEHSDLIESVDVEVRKYNEAKELITSVSNLIEFYKKKQVEQEQKVAPQPVVEPEEPQEPQGPRTTEPVSE